MAKSEERNVLGRRQLIVLGAAVSVVPSCSSGDPIGGAFGGTADGTPPPGVSTNGTRSDAGTVGGSGSGGSGSGSGGSGSGSGSGGSGSGGSGSGSGGSGSGSGGSGSGGSGSGSGSGGIDAGGSSGGTDAGSSSGTDSAPPPPTCSTSGNVLTLTFAKYPQLKQTGGSVSLNANGYSDPNCQQNGIIVVQQSPGKYVALSSSCTHACCAVMLDTSGGSPQFFCPCHGATFDLAGKATGGPTRGDLPTLAVCSDATAVYVTLA